MKKESYQISVETKIHKVEIPKDFSRHVDYSRFNNSKIREILLEFVVALNSNFNKGSLANFYNNINHTSISKNIFLRPDNGYFEYDNNNINMKIVVRDYPHLYHELFHLSSSTTAGKIIFNGFSQEYEEDGVLYTIGDSLNEGYTEFLARRYFGDRTGRIAYTFEVKVAEKLEKIIGKEKMEDLYLRSDLNGLVEELSKYTDVDNVKSFIICNDFVNLYDQAKMSKTEKRTALKESIAIINDFLAGVFLTKEQMRKDNGEITKEEFTESLRSFIEMFKMQNEDGSYSYPDNSDTINEILEALKGKNNAKVYSKIFG